MGGVDLADKQTAYNMLYNRLLNCWKKVLACNLLEFSMTNAKNIYKQHNRGSLNNDIFMLDIINIKIIIKSIF